MPVHLAQAPQSKDGIPIIDKPSIENIPQTPGDSKIKYSINANDNSSESLSQKIRNKVSGLLGNDNVTKRRKAQITADLSKVSRYRIMYGHVAGDADIVIDDLQKVIMSRHAYEWNKLLPVVGKRIAKELNIT